MEKITKTFEDIVVGDGKFATFTATIWYTEEHDAGDYDTPPSHDLEVYDVDIEALDVYDRDGDKLDGDVYADEVADWCYDNYERFF